MSTIPTDQAIMYEQQMIAQYRGQIYQLQMQIENIEGSIGVCEKRLKNLQLPAEEPKAEGSPKKKGK